MASTSYAATEEMTNINRVSRLLMDPCTDQLRDLLRFYIPPANFNSVIQTAKSRLPRLTEPQQKLILPNSGVYSGNYDDMDISLLYILLRNVCGIQAHNKGWGNTPDSADRSVSANIERLRLARNRCGHSTGGMSNAEFNQMRYTSGGKVFLFVAFAMFAQTGNTAASAMDDAKDIIDTNSGQSHQELAEKIYTELNRNYPWRNWFVAVYDPVRGAEPHWIGVCGGDYAFRYHLYNLLVASSSSGTSALNRNWAYGKLSNAPLYKRGFWGNQVEVYAREIFNRMSPDQVGDQCDDWYAFGLVHHSANFYAKADWSRKVIYTKLGEQRRGGHRHGYTFFLFK